MIRKTITKDYFFEMKNQDHINNNVILKQYIIHIRTLCSYDHTNST